MSSERRLSRWLCVVLCVAGLGVVPAPAGAASLRVVGKQLYAGSAPIRLLGVNRSGTEYVCLGGDGQYFQGPADQASVSAMRSWRINAVRVPINESCWLGIDRTPRTGAAYRRAVARYVRLLLDNGLYVIIDSHVAGDGSRRADTQLPMADARHTPALWRSVARYFRRYAGVAFDLYNEPHDISWSCWKNGCAVPAGTAPSGNDTARYRAYRAAGMQQLVDAVRSTGARQPLLLGGLQYAGDLSGWLSHRPRDPVRALVASLHTYGPVGDPRASPCDQACLATVLRVAARVPVVTGELGEYDCMHGYIDSFMPWADARGISYLGWAWDVFDDPALCGGFPLLITGYDGTPSNFGIGLRDHLRSLAAG